MSTRVPMVCPNCQNSLMVRTEYFGRVIECLKCQHPFTPTAADVQPDPSDPVATPSPAPVEKIKVECSHCHEQVKIRRQYLGRLVTCCLCENTFTPTSPAGETPASSEPVEPSPFTRVDERLAEIEARIQSLRAESATPFADLERALAEQVQHRQAISRMEAGLAAMLGDLDAVRRGSSNAGEVHAKLEALRSQLLEPIERQTVTLAEAHAGVERLSAALDSLNQRLDGESTRVEEQHEALGRLAGDQVLARQELRELADLRPGFEARVAGLETAQAEIEMALAELRERAIDDAHLSQDRRLAAESDRGSFRDELKQLRLELETIRQDARERADRDRAEIEELRNELQRKPAPAAADGQSPGVVGLTRLPLPLDLHELAQDLIDWRGESAEPTPAVVTQEPPRQEADYEDLRRQFNRSMSEGNLVQAGATARTLLDLSRSRFGERSSKHALWLRNLGVCLISKGELAEARSLLLLAWEISLAELRSNPMPHAVCLVDLGDLHTAEKDFTQARTAYMHAQAILKKVALPADNPLVLRLQRALSQFEPKPTIPSKFGTMSITT